MQKNTLKDIKFEKAIINKDEMVNHAIILTSGKNLLEDSAMIKQILHCIQDDNNN